MVTSLAEVQKLVDAKYGGIALESVVQGWFYLGNYQRGIEAYKELEKPCGRDDRWLGVCYMMVPDRMKALEVLYGAASKGEKAAHIELARTFSFLERDAEASAELEKVSPEELAVSDQVLWYRAQSIHQETANSLQASIDSAEEAWRRVQGIPEFPVLAPWVLIRLGLLNSKIGRAKRALWCFERGFEVAGEAERWYLQAARVDCLISLGYYTEAILELEKLNSEGIPKVEKAHQLMYRADAAWATGDVKGALHAYDQAAQLALEVEENYVEVLSRLSVAALLGFRRAFEAASENLVRAKWIASTRFEKLSYRFREVLLAYWRGLYNPEQARTELEALAADFGTMGFLQEQGRVRLHLAEVYRALGDNQYLKELDGLQALGVALQNHAFLAREWALLPDLREAALVSHPKLAGEAPTVLEVYTLGQEKLVLAGQTVNIRLRRAPEMLAYFLEHKEVGLKRLLADVFADDKPKTARTYFHQFRSELRERVPGLAVEYDAGSRLYRLVSEVDILWDVAELRAGRKMGELGIFLPGSGSEWAYALDGELEPLRNRPAYVPGSAKVT